MSVTQQFVTFELRGGRLTAEGWQSAGNRFFLHAEPPPAIRTVEVVSRKHYVTLGSLAPPTGEATVSTAFPKRYGSIDSQLRLKLAGANARRGVPVLAGTSRTYKLIYSPRHWELDSEWKAQQVMGSLHQARIVDFQKDLLLDLPAAEQYVREIREKTTDPAIRKNADATLATLRRLKN